MIRFQMTAKRAGIKPALFDSLVSGVYSGLEVGRRLGTHLAEAITAIHRPVAPGSKRHHCVIPAFCAVDWIHFFGAVLVHSRRPLLGPSYCSTAATAFRFVAEPSGLEKFLFPSRKNEFPATLHAVQGSICQCHW